MANSRQAKKRHRQNLRRMEVNRARRSNMRSSIRKLEEAIAGGDKAAAADALAAVEPIIARAAQKGIIHRNTAARKISRLSSRVNTIAE